MKKNAYRKFIRLADKKHYVFENSACPEYNENNCFVDIKKLIGGNNESRKI